ncbi:hypothetical protein MEU_03488, partial [Candida albicans P37005]
MHHIEFVYKRENSSRKKNNL